ncbi:MAG: hypothetical protein GY929_27120 [Actinomycetia bacterium]|nr:hypothetical protein [Actinomycetes bacterium]
MAQRGLPTAITRLVGATLFLALVSAGCSSGSTPASLEETSATTLPALEELITTTSTEPPAPAGSTLAPDSSDGVQPLAFAEPEESGILTLRQGGISDLDFFVSSDRTVPYLELLLGAADADSGWVEGWDACVNLDVRSMRWAGLHVNIAREVGTELDYLIGYSVEPMVGAAQWVSVDGLTAGLTADQVAARWPNSFAANAAWFTVGSGYSGALQQTSAGPTVAKWGAGEGCS